MIRFIAALDSRRGIADEHGIPWQGKLPSDMRWFRDHTLGHVLLMGRSTYDEFNGPLPGRQNFVATHQASVPGAEAVSDVAAFLRTQPGDVWVIGGARLFEATLSQADELYLTQLEGDFGCTKFFPPYQAAFKRAEAANPITENGITYRFEVWRRKAS